ncbi:MAG: peptidoglycan DD-metalloendopeptidase family protein [Melioribacteraceae bacterium]|nr:peptidoglycan DD-metalloendopeptidase family protein [Melioribacteraceae bacterium]
MFLFFIPAIIIYIFILIPDYSEDESDVIADSTAVNQVHENEYRLQVDSLVEFKSVVEKNETLSDILLAHNMDFEQIINIVKAARPVFDFRKIQSDKNYTIYYQSDSIAAVKYFVYEIDPINYVVCDLTDSIEVFKASRDIVTKIRSVSGVIDNSLYMTLSENGISDLLSSKLADVYAWQIDFYAIQKGDFFKVIFEENYVNDNFIGIGKVNAAVFTHRDKPFYAFRYNMNGKDEFFDEIGNSLRKAFLKAPLRFSRISSGYTNKRFHPILKYYRPHRGIDYAAPHGTPVQAVGDGLITDVRWTKQGGRFVKIKHNSVYSSGYMHLSSYAKGITPGKRVQQGQIIGRVGSSGLATGPHLDFRFWKNGELVNYLKQEFPSSHPINKNLIEDFFGYRDSLKSGLDSIKVHFPFDQTSSSEK